MYSDSTLSYTTINTIMKVIQAIFGIETRKEDILRYFVKLVFNDKLLTPICAA